MVVGLGRLLMSRDLVLLWTPGTGAAVISIVVGISRVICLHALRCTAQALEAERIVVQQLDALRAPEEQLVALRAAVESLGALRDIAIPISVGIKLEC